MYQIIASTFGSLELTNYDTRNHSGTLLAGSTSLRSSGDWGKILIQEYSTDGFTIQYSEFSFLQEMRLSVLIDKCPLKACTSIKAKYFLDDENIGGTVKEGQFFLISNFNKPLEIVVDKGIECCQLFVSYKESFIQNLIPCFPILEKIVNKQPLADYVSISVPQWMTKEMNDIIKGILFCQYEPVIRDYYFEDQVEDLLFYMLIYYSKQQPSIKDFSPSDIEKLHQAKAIILNDVSKHHDISALSKQTGLNQFKLKTGFKKLFGAGPFALLKEARMNKAYELLLNSDKPIKDIQFIAGYASLTSFVGAFRKFFGKTPGDIRYR